MVYNSVWEARSVPNLAVQSLEFNPNSVQAWQYNFTSSFIADVDMLTSIWSSERLYSRVQMASEMVVKFKITFFLC